MYTVALKRLLFNAYLFTGCMDTHRPADDPDDPPSRDHAPGALQRVTRQRHDLAAARQPSAAGGPRVLHVPSQY